MKEFLLILHTEGDVWTSLSPEKLQSHIQKGTAYITKLISEGKLKSAQPLDKGSRLVFESNGIIKDGPFNETKEVIAGYFHLLAKDIQEAVEIAKANPIFQDIPTKIEVHPMKIVGGIND
ncbi:MAG TPA: YciI family protein [Puia sp.]|nr:YciI family protein [Puia sp.]